MKKPALSLSPAAINGFLLAHVEKIVFVAAGIFALLLAWWGIDAVRSKAPPSDRGPQELTSLARKVEEHIAAARKPPAGRLPARRPLAPLIDPWRPGNVAIKPLPEGRTPLVRPLFAELTKRTRPDVFPIEDLRAFAGIAVLPDTRPDEVPAAVAPRPEDAPTGSATDRKKKKKKPGDPPDDVGLMGPDFGVTPELAEAPAKPEQPGKITPFVVVTGLVPTGRQQAEYERRFRGTSFRDPRKDTPRWGTYVVERILVGPGNANWERLEVKNVERFEDGGRVGAVPVPGDQKERPVPMEQESLPPGFFLQSDETEVAYAAAVPQRIDEPWGSAVVHPWFIPRIEAFLKGPKTDAEEGGPVRSLALGPLLDAPKDHVGQTLRIEGVVLDKEPERQRNVGLYKFAVKSRDGKVASQIDTIGLGGAVVFAVSDEFGKRLSVDGTTDRPRACNVRVRLDMVNKTPVARILEIELLDEAGASAGTQTDPDPQPVTAEGQFPGAPPAGPGGGPAIQLADSRLFRFVDTTVKPGATYRYRVKFALRNPNAGLAPRHLADPAIAKGDWLIADGSETTEVRVPEPTVLLARTIDKETAKKMRLKGDGLEVMVLAKSEKSGNFALRSVISGPGGIANVDMTLNKSGDVRFFGEKVVTDRLMIDARGPQADRRDLRSQEPPEPLEMLFLRPDGGFELVAAAESERQIGRYGHTLFRPNSTVPNDGRPDRADKPDRPDRSTEPPSRK